MHFVWRKLISLYSRAHAQKNNPTTEMLFPLYLLWSNYTSFFSFRSIRFIITFVMTETSTYTIIFVTSSTTETHCPTITAGNRSVVKNFCASFILPQFHKESPTLQTPWLKVPALAIVSSSVLHQLYPNLPNNNAANQKLHELAKQRVYNCLSR